jgi:hypothetical protein
MSPGIDAVRGGLPPGSRRKIARQARRERLDAGRPVRDRNELG